MDAVKYPTRTEEELFKIHEQHISTVVENFMNDAKSLNTEEHRRDIKVGSST